MLDHIHFSLNHPSSFFQLLAPPANVISLIDGQVMTDTLAVRPRRGSPRDGPSTTCDDGTTRDDLRRQLMLHTSLRDAAQLQSCRSFQQVYTSVEDA